MTLQLVSDDKKINEYTFSVMSAENYVGTDLRFNNIKLLSLFDNTLVAVVQVENDIELFFAEQVLQLLSGDDLWASIAKDIGYGEHNYIFLEQQVALSYRVDIHNKQIVFTLREPS